MFCLNVRKIFQIKVVSVTVGHPVATAVTNFTKPVAKINFGPSIATVLQ